MKSEEESFFWLERLVIEIVDNAKYFIGVFLLQKNLNKFSEKEYMFWEIYTNFVLIN